MGGGARKAGTNGHKPVTGSGPAGCGETGATLRPPDLLSLMPTGFARPPDFRWGLARRRAAGAYVPDGWVDRWVRVGEELLTAPPDGLRGCTDLEAAAAARTLAGTDWPRVAVETRLLAGELAEAVAAKEGLPAAAVGAYEALFYAVTDRLDATGYVTHCVLGLHGPGGHDPRVHVRAHGYHYGPLVADAAIAAFTRPPPGPATPAAERRLYRLVRRSIELRTIPVNERTAGRWARLHFLYREYATRMGDQGARSRATRGV